MLPDLTDLGKKLDNVFGVFLSVWGTSSVSESECKYKNNQRTSERDQRKNFKHKRKFSLSFSLSLRVNGP